MSSRNTPIHLTNSRIRDEEEGGSATLPIVKHFWKVKLFAVHGTCYGKHKEEEIYLIPRHAAFDFWPFYIPVIPVTRTRMARALPLSSSCTVFFSLAWSWKKLKRKILEVIQKSIWPIHNLLCTLHVHVVTVPWQDKCIEQGIGTKCFSQLKFVHI